MPSSRYLVSKAQKANVELEAAYQLDRHNNNKSYAGTLEWQCEHCQMSTGTEFREACKKRPQGKCMEFAPGISTSMFGAVFA